MPFPLRHTLTYMYVLACETLLDSRCRCMELSRPGIVHAYSLPRSISFNARMRLRLRLRAACCVLHASPLQTGLLYYPSSSPKGSGSNDIGKARGVGVGRGGGETQEEEKAGVPLCVGTAPPKETRGGHFSPSRLDSPCYRPLSMQRP